MKKARVSKKIIAAFMAFIIAFASAPIQAIALGIDNMEQIEENVVDTGYEIDEDVFLVEEDLSKRGQFEKHYLCSDGTYVSVTYPEAIHYLDANNKWQDVDQSLTYDSASGMYISDKADFEVSFSNKASADNMARIERNGHTLSWGIQTTKKNGNALSRSAIQPNSSININTDVVLVPSSSVSAIIENPIDNKKTDIKDRLVANNDTFALPKISSQISYSNIFDETQNVSLKYTVYHNKIEEDIIISERGDLQSVSMNMDVGTLTPIVNTDGSVDLVDTNYEMQFHIGIPYMVDADHNVCNDIQVTAVKDGTSCVITYTPNAEWFESSERVFPILLDPSITTNDYVSNIEDTYVEENSTAIHSSEQYLYVTRNGNNRRNAIVRVTKLPEIDESMPIVYATLSLTAQSAATDYVDLKAAYLDTGLELNEYDYSLTTGDYFSYTSYSAMDYDETSVTFDVTAHIYEMYADKKFDDENGYDYHGDFVIGYDYATDTTYLNLWTSGLSNAFEFKVEILDVLRDYYTLPEANQPTPSEIKTILEEELNLTCSQDLAVALFNECYLGYLGLYNQEYLTQQRIQYFNYLKEIVAFCAFSMAAQLDTVNTGSAYNGVNDLKEDLASCWTNNKESSDVMLGTNYGGRSYAKVAEEGNYKYFYSRDYDYYRVLYGNDFTRDVNMRFLDKCFEQQCTFYFSHHPTAYTGGSLYAEYQYITSYYSQQGKTTQLVKLAEGLWKLIIS